MRQAFFIGLIGVLLLILLFTVIVLVHTDVYESAKNAVAFCFVFLLSLVVSLTALGVKQAIKAETRKDMFEREHALNRELLGTFVSQGVVDTVLAARAKDLYEVCEQQAQLFAKAKSSPEKFEVQINASKYLVDTNKRRFFNAKTLAESCHFKVKQSHKDYLPLPEEAKIREC